MPRWLSRLWQRGVRRDADTHSGVADRRYLDLLETLPLVVYSVDPNPPYAPLYVSRGIEAFGYTRKEWLAEPDRWIRAVHPDDRKRVLAATEVALRKRQPIEYEYRLLTKEGAARWVHDRGGIVADSESGRDEWRGVIVDITAGKNIESALVESEERYRRLVESSPDAILVHKNGRIQFANAAAQALFGAETAEQLEGYPVIDLVHPEWRSRVAERIRVIQTEGRSVSLLEEKLLTLDGRTIFADVTGVPITFHGEPAVLVMARDVTERREAAAALRTSEERLRQAQRLEVVGQLAGGIAHDFNNLLMVITSHAGFVREATSGRDDIAKDLDELRRAAERAAELTKQLLAFGRRQVLKPVLLDVNDVVDDSVRMLRRVVPENVGIRSILDKAVPRVVADAGQLEQVFTNLIVNARDAMPEGGSLAIRTEQVFLREGTDAAGESYAAGKYVRVSVADSGTGMDANTLSRAFEPFFTTKEPGRGSGLGLATVHGIVKQSGGFVTADSQVDVGTTIRVHLPAAVQTSATA